MGEVKHAPELVERVARELCFVLCKRGDAIALGTSCVGTCKDSGDCYYWEAGFSKDAIAALDVSAHHELVEALEALVNDAMYHASGDDRSLTLDVSIERAQEVLAKLRGQS